MAARSSAGRPWKVGATFGGELDGCGCQSDHEENKGRVVQSS